MSEEEVRNKAYSRKMYKKGMILYKRELYSVANKLFKEAAKYSDFNGYKKLGVGIIHEEHKRWNLAIEAYKEELLKSNNNYHCSYRLGLLLKRLNRPNEAIEYLEKSISQYKVLSSWYYNLARTFEDLGDDENASINYEKSIARQQIHRAANFRRYGAMLAKNGDFKKAAKIYDEAELHRIPSNMSTKAFENNITDVEIRYAMAYEFYNKLDSRMIFYESMSGSKMMGNPFSIFNAIYNDRRYKDYMHVWVVNTFANIPSEYIDKENIIFVKRNSDAYLKYITMSKYLICDSVFGKYFTRKKDQLFLQTTHGIYYKTVGRESENKVLGVSHSSRHYIQSTHLIAPNDFMVAKEKSSYSIEGIYSGEIAKVGYPRIDDTLNMSDEKKITLKQKLNIHDDKKLVLYAPTWRGDGKFDVSRLCHDLSELSKLSVHILFRGHPITRKLLKGANLPKNVIVPTDDISTNDIMAITDILISDYSSVFFDFIPTEKPIVHYLYDLDDYLSTRGLNLSEDDLPGFVAKTTNELIDCVKRGVIDDTPDEKYLKAKSIFCPYDQGESSINVANWFFRNDKSGVRVVKSKNRQRKILYFGGMLTDRMVLSEMVSSMSDELKRNSNVTAMFSSKLAKDQDVMSYINSLPTEKINFLPYGTGQAVTLEEFIALAEFAKTGDFTTEKAKNNFYSAYRREWRRLFGDSKFDEIIILDPNNPMWKPLKQIGDGNLLNDSSISWKIKNKLNALRRKN